MSREHRRVDLTPAWILHHRPYRETSQILDVLTREYGRVTLFARAVRGTKSALAALLQPFRPLLVAFAGRGDAAQLVRAEAAVDADGASVPAPLPAATLLPAFYANELLLKLTARHDPLPDLYDQYGQMLARLRAGQPIEPALRGFELRLLEAVGYGIDLRQECRAGGAIVPGGYYHFRAGSGFYAGDDDGEGMIAGRSIIAMRSGAFAADRELEDARRILRLAIADCLDGRELATRGVARSMAAHERGNRR